jgi:hypothetical protein
MLGFTDPIVDAFVVGNTIVLAVLLALFRPGPHGYFAQYGFFGGLALCFGASGLFMALGVFEVPLIVSIVVWFAVALAVFRLTARQAIQMNFAQALIYISLFVGYVAVVR